MRSLALASVLLALAASAQALNIVVTNDDSYTTANVQRLRLALIKEGHRVLLSVPCANQSGKGGALGPLLTEMPVHRLAADSEGRLTIDDSSSSSDAFCVGDTEDQKITKTFSAYKDGTPVQAAAHGLFEAKRRWGANPDLLISGPNEGRNVGFAVFLSGTLGATHYAIASGVPAIAVSAGSTPKDHKLAEKYADKVAESVISITDRLEESWERTGRLLPKLSGLTINLPDFEELEGASFKLTEVNWYFGNAILWQRLDAPGGLGAQTNQTQSKASGQAFYGLNIFPGTDTTGDESPLSEGRVVRQGFITVSVISATETASKEKIDEITDTLSFELPPNMSVIKK